jgi:glycosyltransferase involved in cell wall biosynthesis/ribosome-associated translation inhibitor RaiA
MQFHLLSFEGPDGYAWAGGVASRVSGLALALAEAGFDTHLWFVGDPDLPGHETHGQLHLHRWCQWISRYHPAGVYDGEEGKRADYAGSLPPFLLQEVLLPTLRRGERAVIIAEEWHTVDAVLHLDRLLRQHGVRQQTAVLWNANNTYGFERIAWHRLAQAAIITTVSRYMKQLMSPLGVKAVVIPNGLPADGLLLPARPAVAAFHARLRGRTVVSKVARWHPDKRWLMAVEVVGAMKRLGWRPLLIARGGIEPYGGEVLAAAAAAGLQVAERPCPQPGIPGLLQALEGLDGVDMVHLCSPLDAESRQLLFHGSAAVLANSGHEPFGLVGLETMAAAGVACVGGSGEDYAVPGYNALVLETAEPGEFLALFEDLRSDPERERALRRAGRATAKQYTWPQILERLLLPRLRLAFAPSTAAPEQERVGRRSRVHIEGRQTTIAPPLLGWIAERLEDLSLLSEDIGHMRLTLIKHTDWRRRRHEARIELLLAGRPLSATYIAKTPYEAVRAALQLIRKKLREAFILRHTMN